jgi:chromosome segregation ATPase
VNKVSLMLVLFAAGTAQAQTEPLGGEALAQCAQQVQQLRSEAPRLLARNDELDVQRESIQQRQRALSAEAAGIGSDDLQAGLDYSERRRLLNQEASTFNAEIERIKDEIRAINVVKQQYAANCAQRSYRRSDFERLRPQAQAAMRAGMEGIEVPYTEP